MRKRRYNWKRKKKKGRRRGDEDRENKIFFCRLLHILVKPSKLIQVKIAKFCIPDLFGSNFSSDNYYMPVDLTLVLVSIYPQDKCRENASN
jgi:hypothetical protein